MSDLQAAPGRPGYIVLSDEDPPEDPDELCPCCGRRLWFVVEVMVQRHEESVRAFVEETRQGDRELLEGNRVSAGLLPLTPEQLAKNGLEGTTWGEGDSYWPDAAR